MNVLPVHFLKESDSEKMLRKSDLTLVAYGSADFTMNPTGEKTLEFNVDGKKAKISFIIIDSKGQVPLSGVNECFDLNLVKENRCFKVK